MNGIVRMTEDDLEKPSLHELMMPYVETPKLKVAVVIRTAVGQAVHRYLTVLASQLPYQTTRRGQTLTLPNGATILVVGEGYLEPLRGRQVDVVFVRPDAAPSVLNTVVPCLIASKAKRVVYYE